MRFLILNTQPIVMFLVYEVKQKVTLFCPLDEGFLPFLLSFFLFLGLVTFHGPLDGIPDGQDSQVKTFQNIRNVGEAG